jgi:C1A family cysteine protease
MPILPPDELNAAISQSHLQWTAGPTAVAALSEEQRHQLLGVVVDREAVQAAMAMARDAGAGLETAVAIDWRSKDGRNYVTPVKDQGSCGSCVSFCACSVLESTVLIQNGLLLDLSEADLHFCSSHGPSCDGWWPSDAMDSLKTRGVADEACFPYQSAFTSGGTPQCNACSDRDSRAVTITGYSTLASMNQRKNWLSTRGTVSAVIHVYDDFFSYKSGIYSHVSGGHAGYHCIQIVGYSDTEGCWIGKNSWGSLNWGISGFFKMAYGECGIDDTSQDVDENGAGPLQFPMYGIEGATLPHTTPVSDPVIRRGSRGEAVMRLQTALTQLGFGPGPIDGIFGPLTDSAVRAYQSSRGLLVDGVVGPQTWGSLHSEVG